MTVTGIAMMKDEADVAHAVVEHMLTQVDEILVADNGSTDGTREILEILPVTLIDDQESGYYQSAKMTALAQTAIEAGADWVVPFDADEWWYSPFADRLSDVLAKLAPQWLCASAALYDHVATGADPDEPDPFQRLGYRRRNALPLVKVACRAHPELVVEQGNHGATYPGGTTVWPGELVVRHFPYRSPEQFVTKARNGARAYAATDLPETMGAHWRQYGALLDSGGPQVLEDVFHEWFYVKNPKKDPSLIFDPVTGL